MDEKIDILMATYNGERYLKEQIESILNQTYSNIRLLICDDLSTDNTYNILKEYEKKDKRVKVTRNENNLGVTKNFEKLLSMVESKYYMFSDQDDVWNSDKVELSYRKLKKENADLVFTDLTVVDENLNVISKSFNRLKKIYRKIIKYDDLRMVYLYNVVTGCTIISKSSYINKIIPLPENKDILHDHYIPLLILSQGGKLSYLDMPTIQYRQHPSNQVGSKRYTSSLKSFDDVRNHLINVKISIFKEYTKLTYLFNKKINSDNEEYLKYFENLKSIKNISLKNTKEYFKIYKNEKLSYKLFYYFMFHIPVIYRFGYKIINVFRKK